MGERDNGYLSAALYERNFGAEATGDFILSDYQNEIRRILHVSQTVLPPAKYVGNDSVEFNGTVDYQVMYIGADGGIYSIPLSSDYSFSVPLDKGNLKDIIADVSVICSIVAEGVSTRVSAPRKLSIKSRLRPCVRVYAKIPSTERIESDVSGMDIYRRQETVECAQCECGVSDVIPVLSTLPVDSEDTRVVFAEAMVDVIDTQITQNGVSCRGNIIISILCVGEDSGEYKTLTSKNSFEGDVDIDGISEGNARVNGTVSEMSVTLTDVGIECNIGVLLQATVCENTPIGYTADVYSVKNECDCIMRDVSSRNMKICQNANFTVSERIPLSSTGMPEGADIFYSMGSVNMDKCELIGGKYVFSGNGVFTAIYKKEEDIYASDVTVPVKYETDAVSAQMPVCYDCVAWVTDMSAKINDGNLSIDAEVSLSADCFTEGTVQTVDRVVLGDEIPTRDTEIVICYPSSEDTSWSVAKRYKVAPTKVIGNPSTDKYVMIE